MPPKVDKNAPVIQTGNGKFVYQNGNIYEGEYIKEGDICFRQGSGIFIVYQESSRNDVALTEEQKYVVPPIYHPNDIVKMEGQWTKDTFVEGCISFGSGARYDGKLKDLLFENGGRYTFSNGVSYTGEFVNNMIHGVGIVEKDGVSLERAVYRNNYGPGLPDFDASRQAINSNE